MKGKKILHYVLSGLAGLFAIVVLVIGTSYLQGKKNLSKNLLGLDETDIKRSYETKNWGEKDYYYKDNLVNILCIGVDKEEEMALRNDVDNSIGQADAIFLVSLDLEEEEVHLITIPRDTMVKLEMYNSDGYYMGARPGQITLQYAYADGLHNSAYLTVYQVSRLLDDIPIHAYVAINVYSLWNLNDIIGGVDITMDEDYTLFNPAFEKGETVHLTGNLLENYIRGRDKTERGSSYKRNHRLKQYMLAYFEQAKEAVKEDIKIPFYCLEALKDNMVTNITEDEMIYLLSQVLDCSFSEEKIYTIPGEQILGEQYEEFYVDEAGLEEFIIELFYEQ